jgi:hypothetical protein
MRVAKEVFQDLLSELATLSRETDFGSDWRWSADYLTRARTYYHFSGNCTSGIISSGGRRLDMSSAHSELPTILVTSALADFFDNLVLTFYVGRERTVTSIASEVMEFSANVPDVVLIEIDYSDPSEAIPRMRELTRLAFVGLQVSDYCLSGAGCCEGKLQINQTLRPEWYAGRRKIFEAHTPC